MIRKILLLSLILVLTACAANNRSNEGNRKEVIPQGVSVQDSHINMKDNQNISDNEKAKHLSNLAANMPNVNQSSAVVIGDLAVVGIDVDGDVDRTKVGSIKNSVVEGLRHDPHGAGAIVIADPDITDRLNQMQQDISAGQPIQGIMNELSAIVGRVMPDIPLPEQGKNPQTGTENQKNELNDSQEKQLEKEQEDQSNQHK